MNGDRNVRTQAVAAGASRRWCLAAVILHDPDETLDGSGILTESDGPRGLLLWQVARDVGLWTSTPFKRRAGLFSDGYADRRAAMVASADVPSSVAASVATITGMLTLGERADASVLTLCCLEIAAWARRERLLRTALAFAQTAGLASPRFAEAALQTGISAVAAGQDPRAETWLRRAVDVARREKDWPAYTAALAELGELHERHASPAAGKLFACAFKAGRRFGLGAIRMRAAHGLFRLARGRGDGERAEQFALAAQAAFKPDASGGVALLLDLARFWTDVKQPARARSALRRLSPSLSQLSPADRLTTFALLARSWAASPHGEAHVQRAADSAWEVGGESIPDEVRFAAAMDLAHAARMVGDLPAFKRARAAVLRHAPQGAFRCVVNEVAALWPDGEPPPPLDRAS